jgi:predicted dehydrogenase
MSSTNYTPRLSYGMVGGGRDAFIGAVHRMAAELDHEARFVAGALSSSPEKAIASGRDLGLAPERNYPTWQAMLEGELKRPANDRIDFVSIVTPNHAHYEVAKAFAAAGIHVVLDKPMVHSSAQAADLISTVESSRSVFGVTYNYTGYPLVKQARHMVKSGVIGEVRKVIVEYNQGWLAQSLESAGQKQADWRTDPARSGLGGAIGDIGSHAENLVSTITGLELEAICADLTTFVEGRRLDDDASLLLRFTNGARGILMASQVCVGYENDLRIRVCGESGSLEWRQEDPNFLIHRPIDQCDRTLRRAHFSLCEEAKKACRTPTGHPEAFIEAFANVYREIFKAIRSNQGGPDAAFDFPSVRDGARGVRFIEKTVESSKSSAKWTSF